MGNSKGVRLPKPLIEQAGITEEVDLEIRGAAIVIRARQGVREGWAEAARGLREDGCDRLLDPVTPTRFDETEWEW